MRGIFAVFSVFLAFGALAMPANASVDSTCYPEWSLESSGLSCAGSAIISPGNDTRANLLLLLQDGKNFASASDYPDLGWDRGYGRNFFNWSLLRSGLYPTPALEREWSETDFGGSRCQTYASGTAAFSTAIAANSQVSKGDREALIAGRQLLLAICQGEDVLNSAFNRDDVQKPAAPGQLNIATDGGQAAEFLTYLNAAAAFYAGDWQVARDGFSKLNSSADKWLKETALYMVARVHLNAAQDGAFDKWGDFDGSTASGKAEAENAEKALLAYLSAYPDGRYSASAKGLLRRAYWLRQDGSRLAQEYQKLVSKAVAGKDNESVADLVEEIDIKLLFVEDIAGKIEEPHLLATLDLLRMRSDEYPESAPLTLAELEKQRSAFANHVELFDFLLANHAFYVENNPKKILQLIPDAARQDSFSYLQFSRQALRGLALQKLNDRNEGGFWRDMLDGSNALYQRPAVELGLAIFYERNGDLDKIFAADSPLQESGVREILLSKVAGPIILRNVVANKKRPRHERDVALFTLLYKQLSRGQYGGFVESQKQIGADADSESGLWALLAEEKIPVGLFGPGARDGDYACPALRETAATLAQSPKDIGARLCLGDFWLANGFDGFEDRDLRSLYGPDDEKSSLVLGTSKSQFPGSVIARHDIYTDIIASGKGTADQRAYALYRAVRCYATIGNNSCGGKDVALPQRKAWYNQLKNSYPNSKWAKQLKYYW